MSIEFPNGMAVYTIDDEIASVLKKAHVKFATLAVESGSERVLREIIHKPLRLDMVKTAVDSLKKVDIYVRAFFILGGLPGETEKDREITKQFIKEIGFNWVAIMIATPIVGGSDLYIECVENGYLTSDSIEDFHYGRANIKTPPDFTPDFIENERYNMNLSVNFVENHDLHNGNIDTAIIGFADVIKRVPNHAFAHYFLSICYEKKQNYEKSKYHSNIYMEIIDSSEIWKKRSEFFLD